MNSKKKSRIYQNKVAIGPVVATALLLVVAVVAVIGFQSWFGMYSSEIFVSTEKKSTSTFGTSVEAVVGDKLYLVSSKNVSVYSVKLNGQDCGFSDNLSVGSNEVDVSSCVSDGKVVKDVVIVTSDEVLSKKFYVDNDGSSLGISSVWCYQESANVSTVCGGLATGNYMNAPLSGFGVGQFELVIDSDWNTFGFSNGDSGGFINYTIPVGATSNSYLQVKDYAGTRNLSLFSCNIESQSMLTILLDADVFPGPIPPAASYVSWNCYNGSTYVSLYSYSNTTSNVFNEFYEEAMWWNIQN